MKVFMLVIGYILYIVTGLGAVAFHLWTVLMFMGMWGWPGGILSFIFPGFSWLLMVGISIADNGILNTYVLYLLAIFLSYGLAVGSFMIGAEKIDA